MPKNMPENMSENMPEQIIKKSKKHYSIIFWLALTILIYAASQYLWSEFSYKQAKNNAPSQFANVETQIYQTTPAAQNDILKTSDQPLNPTEILLKQQIQINELQTALNAVRLDLARLKTNDGLAKIILNFVKLQDLVLNHKNYDRELQKLEILCRADFALSAKIAQLKIALQNQPKNQSQLSKEFANLIPQIKAKQIEIESGQTWWGKIKAVVGRFIVIKKTGENSTESNIEKTIFRIKQAIENNQPNQALQDLNLLGNDYQEIILSIKNDLQNAHNFKQISDEIYQYLESLS